MANPAAPPASKVALREVVREALAAYRENSAVLLITALVVFVPIGLLEAATHGLGELDADEADALGIVVALGTFSVLVATATMGDVFYTGIVAAVVGERRTGVRRELAEIARNLPYLRLLAVDVIFILALAAGLVLLIVPGILVFGWFALAAPVVEIEDRGVGGAFRRSRELVRGNFWRVLMVLAPLTIVSGGLGEFVQSGGPWILGDDFAGHFVGAVLAEAVTVPPFALAAVVTTHHLISGAAPPSPRTRPA
jgi:hypothetical protein